MGKVLAQIFRVVEEKGGLPGRLKLAEKMGLTLQKAGEIKDKAALVKRAKRTAAEILAMPIEDLLD